MAGPAGKKRGASTAPKPKHMGVRDIPKASYTQTSRPIGKRSKPTVTRPIGKRSPKPTFKPVTRPVGKRPPKATVGRPIGKRTKPHGIPRVVKQRLGLGDRIPGSRPPGGGGLPRPVDPGSRPMGGSGKPTQGMGNLGRGPRPTTPGKPTQGMGNLGRGPRPVQPFPTPPVSHGNGHMGVRDVPSSGQLGAHAVPGSTKPRTPKVATKVGRRIPRG